MQIYFVLLFGLIIGSFLNVCIYRIPREESIAFPPSHCTNCNNKLKAYDLIPIISYLFLKGKCRYCGEKISIRYPIIEMTTGVVFLALNIEYGFTLIFYKYSILACFLIVIGMIDLDTTDVYLKTTLSGIITGIICLIVEYFMHYSILTYLYGGLLGGSLIALIILITHGMGWGDAEICTLIGLFLGIKLTVVMLFFSFIFGGFTGAALILLKLKSRKDYIPFGPYIAAGCMFTVLFGERILQWYMSTLI